MLKAASHHGAPRIYSSQHPQPTLRARKVLTMRTMRRSLWRIPLSTEAIQTFVPSVRGMTVSDKGLAAAVLGMALKKAWGPPGRGPRSVQFPPARLACLCVAPQPLNLNPSKDSAALHGGDGGALPHNTRVHHEASARERALFKAAASVSFALSPPLPNSRPRTPLPPSPPSPSDERAMTLARSGARPLMQMSGFEPWRVGGSRDGAPFGKAWA